MIYIGIDTGKHTGFAVWDSTCRKFLRIDTLAIHEAMLAVLDLLRDNELFVVFEDARQRKWYGNDARKVQAKLKGAGSIERDCTIWEDFLIDIGVRYRAVPPRKGLTKWDAESFSRMTGWKGRCSEHARDAALLVWGY